MDRKASAVWQGGLKDGKGTLSSDSGVLKQTPYSFQTRFESTPGTNPEELLAAAHAGCFAMALSLALGKAGFAPERIDAEARVTIEPADGGFAIRSSRIVCEARVPGIDEKTFAEHAEATQLGCPVSKALAGVEITLDARLAQ